MYGANYYLEKMKYLNSIKNNSNLIKVDNEEILCHHQKLVLILYSKNS